RSATLPTKRAGASNYNANASAHSGAAATAANQKSRWVGGYADETKPAARRVSGWGSRARDTGWDHSSDDDDDVTPLSRRGAGTQTWYGPREGIRPISMFPPARANAAYPIPPVPLMFGADDSDDDIDLEGDEGSSRTPAALGLGLARGLRTYAGSPNPSIRSRQDSVSTLMDRSRNLRFVPKPSALATSVPLSSPLTVVQTPLAVSGGKYDHLAQEAGSASRPRGISDPEGRQSSRSSHIQSSNRSSWRPAGETASSRPGSKDDSLQQPPAIDGKAGPLRPSSGSEPLSARGFSVATGGGSGAVAGKAANMAAYVPPSAPKSSGLAALLATKMVVRQNPFSEEFGAMGGAAADTNLVELNIFLQYNDKKSQPRSIRVRKAATVEQAIGFALYQHVEDDLEPKLEGSEQDVVMWALRIAMDGEIDDDFPAFDRSRPVANFAFDEFALCLATPDQVKVNEGLRVRHGRPPRMLRPKSLMPPTPSTNPTATALAAETDSEKNSAELLFTITPRVETSAMVLQPSRIATASTAGIFVGTSVLQNQGTQEAHSLSAAAEESSVSQPPQSRLLRVRVLGETSSADALRATTIEADANATIRIVLAQVCRKKQLIEDQYVLGVFDNSGFVVCSSDMAVSQIPSGIEMYLHRVGAALPTLGQVPQPPE
ncbi:Component of a membrane-bound complex containing the Tor2p kinase, partial [Coemansia sp. RSA 2611]